MWLDTKRLYTLSPPYLDLTSFRQMMRMWPCFCLIPRNLEVCGLTSMPWPLQRMSREPARPVKGPLDVAWYMATASGFLQMWLEGSEKRDTHDAQAS